MERAHGPPRPMGRPRHKRLNEPLQLPPPVGPHQLATPAATHGSAISKEGQRLQSKGQSSDRRQLRCLDQGYGIVFQGAAGGWTRLADETCVWT